MMSTISNLIPRYKFIHREAPIEAPTLFAKSSTVIPNVFNGYYNVTQLANIYEFPSVDTSVNSNICILSFGGGLYGTSTKLDSGENYEVTNGDIQKYMSNILGIPNNQMPKIYVSYKFGATYAGNLIKDDYAKSTVENTLDATVVAGCCPSPNLKILLYVIPNGTVSFSTALGDIINNGITISNVLYKPKIISISWGNPEENFSSFEKTSLSTLLQTATQNGYNICVSTGDYGSRDGTTSGPLRTDFPSSCPYVTAVGGTRLIAPNFIYDSQTVETVWNHVSPFSSTGGGISIAYTKPSYQSSITTINTVTNVTGRCIPDVSLNADPSSGIFLYLNGILSGTYGGTSMSAPFFASYLLLSNIIIFVNPLLYTIYNTQQTYNSCFHDITQGLNYNTLDSNAIQLYMATPGYDCCTGLGSIVGTNLTAIINNNNSILATSISVVPTSSTLNIGQTVQATKTILPSNTTNKAVTWSSSNTGVATVNSSGLITGVSGGTAIITVTTADGSNKTANVSITVNTPASSISVVPTSGTLNVGQAVQATQTILPSNTTNKAVTWSSSNTDIATVNSSGLIIGLRLGSATITVTTADGSNKTATVSITVSPILASSVSVTPTSSNINLGTTLQATATVSPNNTANKAVTWASNNPSIATVSNTGLITGVSTGSAIITVTTADGSNKTATISVTVIVILATSVTISPTSSTLPLNNSLQATATVLSSNTTNKAVTWSSSNTNIATVSNTGAITPRAIGTAIITVTTADGSNKKANLTLTVVAAVYKATSITVSPTSGNIAIRSTLQATATILPVNTSNKVVAWSSNRSIIASVSSSGLITGVAQGTATITASTTDGTGYLAIINITVSLINPTSITVSPVTSLQNPRNLAKNATLQATATILPINASNKTVRWVSNNIAVATVTNNGLIKGINPGNAIITAFTYNAALSATIYIRVTSATTSARSIVLSSPSDNLTQHTSLQLNAMIYPEDTTNQNIKWVSSNSKIISVDSSGLSIGRLKGTTYITAITTDGTQKSSTIKLDVI